MGLNTDIISADTIYVSGNSITQPYKVYAATLIQTGTTDPVPTVLYSTLNSGVLFQRTTIGRYLIQSASNEFTNGKTVIIGTQVDYNYNFMGFTCTSAPGGVQISMGTIDNTANYADDLLNGDFIEIRVYN